jgi:hypothetical protein
LTLQHTTHTYTHTLPPRPGPLLPVAAAGPLPTRLPLIAATRPLATKTKDSRASQLPPGGSSIKKLKKRITTLAAQDEELAKRVDKIAGSLKTTKGRVTRLEKVEGMLPKKKQKQQPKGTAVVVVATEDMKAPLKALKSVLKK